MWASATVGYASPALFNAIENYKIVFASFWGSLHNSLHFTLATPCGAIVPCAWRILLHVISFNAPISV
eukprot:9932913-Karenia_brevis.AAC.1